MEGEREGGTDGRREGGRDGRRDEGRKEGTEGFDKIPVSFAARNFQITRDKERACDQLDIEPSQLGRHASWMRP